MMDQMSKEAARYKTAFHLHESVRSAKEYAQALSKVGSDADAYGKIASDLRTLESMTLGLRKKAFQEAEKAKECVD